MSKVAKIILGGAILGALAVFTFGLSVPVLGALTTKIAVATGMHLVAAGAIAGGLLAGSLAFLKPVIPVLSAEFGREIQLNGDPVAVRKIFYGDVWTAGTLRFRQATGTDNKDLYMVMVLCGHPINSVQVVEADGETLTLDSSGIVTSPSKWAGLIQIYYFLGLEDQLADNNLVSLFPEWTNAHRLRGLAYAVVKLTFNEEKLNGPPQFRFKVQGRKVYDPRLDSTNGGTGSQRLSDNTTWSFSRNAVLCAADYLRGIRFTGLPTIAGVGVADARLDWANVIAEANVCTEAVSLAAGGTQQRYLVNGFIDPRQPHGTNIRHFELAMAGDITLSDGKWRFFAGAFRAPTLHLSGDHFIGPLRHIVHKGESQRFDTVQGVFASNQDSGSVLDYPPVSLGSAVVGEERVLGLDFALVNNAPQAQRCAKLILERENAGKHITCTTSLYGYRAVPGETIEITHPAFGLSAQDMRVNDVQLTMIETGEDKMGLAVDLTLEAGPASLYAWNAEEVALATAPILHHQIVPPKGSGTGPGGVLILEYDGLDLTELAELGGHYSLLTDRASNITGTDNNFQDVDAVLLNNSDQAGANWSNYFQVLLVNDTIVFFISTSRWFFYRIDQIYTVVGTGTEIAYKYGLTLIDYRDSNPDDVLSSGTQVSFQFNRQYNDNSNLLVDPDFDLSTAVAPFYGSKHTETGTPPIDGSIVFDATGGVGGSHSFTINRGAASISTSAWMWNTRKVRGNFGTFIFRIRYKTTDASNNFFAAVDAYDKPSTTTELASAETEVNLVDTSDAWTNLEIEVTFTTPTTGRYFLFRWGFNDDSGAPASVDIDSVFVYAVN